MLNDPLTLEGWEGQQSLDPQVRRPAIELSTNPGGVSWKEKSMFDAVTAKLNHCSAMPLSRRRWKWAAKNALDTIAK